MSALFVIAIAWVTVSAVLGAVASVLMRAPARADAAQERSMAGAGRIVAVTHRGERALPTRLARELASRPGARVT